LVVSKRVLKEQSFLSFLEEKKKKKKKK